MPHPDFPEQQAQGQKRQSTERGEMCIRDSISPIPSGKAVICLSATTAKNAPSSAERVLAILGSPRADGLSARMLDAFLTELPKGTAVTRISCYDRRPIPCDDCRYCYHREGCSKRDLDDFYAELEEADLVVIATPVYHLSFPAPLKALIDRLQRYWSCLLYTSRCV